MRFHKWYADFQDDGGKEQSLSSVVNDFWNGRDPKVLINAISDELDQGNENSINFIAETQRKYRYRKYLNNHQSTAMAC